MKKEGFNPNAFIISADEHIMPNEQSFPPHPDLLRKTVGGPFTILYVPLTTLTIAGMLSHTKHEPDVAQLIVSEDGEALKFPPNAVASSLAGIDIVGAAVILIGNARVK